MKKTPATYALVPLALWAVTASPRLDAGDPTVPAAHDPKEAISLEVSDGTLFDRNGRPAPRLPRAPKKEDAEISDEPFVPAPEAAPLAVAGPADPIQPVDADDARFVPPASRQALRTAAPGALVPLRHADPRYFRKDDEACVFVRPRKLMFCGVVESAGPALGFVRLRSAISLAQLGLARKHH